MVSLVNILAVVTAAVLGGVLALWISRRTSERQLRQESSEISNLNALARRLLRTQLSVDDLCDLVYWQCGQIVPAALFQLGLFDGDSYIVKVWVQDSTHLPETRFPDGGTKGIVGWIRETGQPLLVRDFEAEKESLPAFPEFVLQDPPRSGVFVPLIAGASTLGVIAIQSRQVGRFTEEHMRLLTALANNAAWAIRNAQLYEHAQLRAERLNLIGQVVAQATTTQALPQLFQQIVDLTKDAFQFYCVSIFVNLDDQELRIGASTDPEFAQEIGDIRLGQGLIGWAADSGKTALATKVAEDTRYRKLNLLPDTQSEVALPLKVDGRVVGILDVQSNEEAAFSSEDVHVLETLAAQVALAIEQAKTYDAEHQLALRLEALTKVIQAVISVLDLDELLDRVVDLITDTFEYNRVYIFLRTGPKLIFRAGVGPQSIRWYVEEKTFDIGGDALISQVGRTGEAAIWVRSLNQENSGQLGVLEDSQSELAVPIGMADRVMGVLDLQSDKPGAFDDSDLRLMQSLADIVAVAIRNSILYVNERRRRALAESLGSIGVSLASNLDLDQLLNGILTALARVITLDMAAVLLWDEEQRYVSVAAVSDPARAYLIGAELRAKTIAENEAETREELIGEYRRLLGEDQNATSIVAPLIGEMLLIGYLVVDHSNPGHTSHHDEQIVMAFASQVAVALNNARLYSAQQAEAWVTTALLQVAEAVNAQTDVDEALETICRLTTLLGGVSRCLILKWNPEVQNYYVGASQGFSGETTAALSAAPLPAGYHPFLDLMSVTDQAFGAGQGYQLPIPDIIAQAVGESVVGIPLRAKQETVGLLIVDDPRAGDGPESRLMNILAGIAHQAATALESAKLQESARERDRLEQELAVAHQIQASFIPDSPPRLVGWEISARWRAARQVSGDFYDFIPLSNGLWGLVIADVADKGVPAALFMAMSRTLLRAAAINRTSPAETLVRVNELLQNDSRSDLFVTVFYAVWNPATGELNYASAGHNPPIVVRKPRRGSNKPEIEEIWAKGMALGILPDVSMEEGTAVLNPGDVLMAYTDGLTEAMRSDYSAWGSTRLVETLRELYAEPTHVIAQRILSKVDEFVSGAPQSDDITFWILRREKPTDHSGK